MALLSLTPYCTKADVESVLSAEGVRLRLADRHRMPLNSAEDDAMQDCIDEATETINYYLWNKYSPTWLAQSNWVARKCAVLAAYALGGRKANPIPESLVDRVERILEELQNICEHGKLLPGIPLRRSLAPTWSNIRANPGYRFRVLRVERNTSSSQPTTQPVQTDWQDAMSWEL